MGGGREVGQSERGAQKACLLSSSNFFLHLEINRVIREPLRVLMSFKLYLPFMAMTS